HGLLLNDVEYFPDLHGGTLRWHIGTRDAVSDTVRTHLADEERHGLTRFEYYDGFATRVENLKNELVSELQRLRSGGATIAAYGAAAKGSTLLNYAGIGTELVQYVVDRNVHKQGRHMPGTHQPISDPAVLEGSGAPDYVLVLAWNFLDEIVEQQADYR